MIQKSQKQVSSKKVEKIEQKLKSRRSSDPLQLAVQESLVDLDEMLLSNQGSARPKRENAVDGKPVQPQDIVDNIVE